MPLQESLSIARIKRLCSLVELASRNTKRKRADHVTLKVSERTLFRDIALLRELGVEIKVSEGVQYRLGRSRDEALARVPLPDPHLTVGEALLLAKASNAGGKKVKALLKTVLG